MNERTSQLSDWQKFTAFMTVVGMILAGLYGLAISYMTVYRLALEAEMPIPTVFPLGIEGGLVAVLALDLLLTWIGRPIAWLRQFARLLAVAAVGINAAAGLEHGVLAVVMHAIAPAILIAGVEALRTHLLRLVGDADELRREPIPRARWLLAPVSTLAMWRRMVLWQTTRYSDALDADLARREAIYTLRRTYGRRWAREIPADVAYRLQVGVRMEEALARVPELVAARRMEITDDLAEIGVLDAATVPPIRLVPVVERHAVPPAVPQRHEHGMGAAWSLVEDDEPELDEPPFDDDPWASLPPLNLVGAACGTNGIATADARHSGGTVQVNGVAHVDPGGTRLLVAEDDGAPGVDTADVREAARAAYRAARVAGRQMTGKQLGESFERSERWGRDRIAEARGE